MKSLSNKRILLGITGGIAAYKCAELARLFVKAGAEVSVVMTRAAQEFVTPLTLQALSGRRVYLDLLDAEAEGAMGHIELARWADLVLIAPATADFIAKLAHGQADDLLSTVVLACSAPIAVAPAMNQAMWADLGTQANLSLITERKISVFGPGIGDQACGDVGPGRMLEPEQLLHSCADLFETGSLAGLKIVINGGPTREAIDPVRFISNHSSGKMAYALANEAVAEGARVTLISGPVSLPVPERLQSVDVESAEEMLQACLLACTDCDVFIGVAAIADYRPDEVAAEKIKKLSDQVQISLVKNPDVISEIASQENRPFMVGFAAETTAIAEHGRQKLVKKKLDLLFANNAVETFNSDSIAVTAIQANSQQDLGPGNKSAVARQMLRLIADQLSKNNPAEE
ncbi:MAG: bifunctional phosphopantothenoylcysteine decarboxylase/phosphopantothenate--cysteine ligase CoaBC [Gammaproteobacteria bacterium]|jgi:phosphopantothenoylcysteine decarboxylase/phosphopantothenate--cysteine ligase|nr:bifunctional phosphopantothenoylcysteine decarboxylase/phosphopantothenate--cysteine ligase CoaBC [Gammaproteobacteria bacterium]MDP6097385.1 bifunctional phosphopantothenoylcysteine decarboxylase/phosphopantothenate--cysteine ligase CoaBC [Gammaproteobacteria bacterium]HJO12734.1 bifunctional phosphopantothenoylcysteine decarboxylase/phosphopantothenate--cysteine ligase CoaBC [Gammaproteobacteria bacterium]|tara:strand:+ start:1841 stop:3046 length:1206 start_codon:yes stop_codon:yes gene_type:complete